MPQGRRLANQLGFCCPLALWEEFVSTSFLMKLGMELANFIGHRRIAVALLWVAKI